jgi:hypothetical protein
MTKTVLAGARLYSGGTVWITETAVPQAPRVRVKQQAADHVRDLSTVALGGGTAADVLQG